MTAVDGTSIGTFETAVIDAVTAISMRTDLFDFPLPPERIALRPARPRDAARLLVVRPGARARRPRGARSARPAAARRPARGQRHARDPGEPARAAHRARAGNARSRRPCIKRLDGSRWRAFVKPGKRLAVGDMVRFGDEGKVCFLGQLDATVEAKGEGGEVTLAFAFHGPVLDQAIAERGDMPLPPYIASRRARRRARTAPTTRPCSRMTKARSRRRPRACISPTSSWRG